MYQQSEQTAAANKYQTRMEQARDKQIEENYQLSVQSANAQYRALQDRSSQEGEAATQKTLEQAREGAAARSRALAAAGEAGVSGLSVNALLTDFMGQEARYRESVATNLGYSKDQLASEMEGVRAQAQGRIASIQPYMRQPVDSPNYFGAAMRVGGNALDAYNKYRAPSSTDSTAGYLGADAGYGQMR
jgi:hypothetical protein